MTNFPFFAAAARTVIVFRSNTYKVLPTGYLGPALHHYNKSFAQLTLRKKANSFTFSSLNELDRLRVRYVLQKYSPIAEKLNDLIQCNFSIDSKHFSNSWMSNLRPTAWDGSHLQSQWTTYGFTFTLASRPIASIPWFSCVNYLFSIERKLQVLCVVYFVRVGK